MDDYEPIISWSKEKAISNLDSISALYSISITAILTVFFPLSFTYDKLTSYNQTLYATIIFILPIFLISSHVYFSAKYKEYRIDYMRAVMRNIESNFRLLNNNQVTTLRLYKRILGITGWKPENIDDIFFGEYPTYGCYCKIRRRNRIIRFFTKNLH